MTIQKMFLMMYGDVTGTVGVRLTTFLEMEKCKMYILRKFFKMVLIKN